MRTHPYLVLLCVFLAVAPALRAQELHEGAMVRLHLERPPPLSGRVQDLSADTLWLRGSPRAQPVALASVRRLELRQRPTRTGSGWKWAKRGLLAGALLGGATCLADQEECVSGVGPEDGLVEGLLAASMFLGGGAALLGFIGGAALPGHVWVEVPLPRRRDPG